MLLKILLGAAVLLVAFLVVVALQPATFHLERSLVMPVPPERVFAQVNDFRAWRAWSPWEGRDPALERTYSGAPSGAGASYGWSSENKEVGVGRMTIEQSQAPAKIVIHLEFIKPFPGISTATYSFVPVSGGTKVTWAMDGAKNFLMKGFHLFVNMDKLLGKDFERGLAQLRSASEAAAKPNGAVANAAP